MTYLVKNFMNKNLVTIDAESSVAEASKRIAENPRGYAIALDKGKPVGMVTERDLVRKILVTGLDPSTTQISQIMSSPLVTIDPDDELTKAAQTMKMNNVRKLPVVQDGTLYGIITARDITDHFSDYVDKTIREILDWIL